MTLDLNHTSVEPVETSTHGRSSCTSTSPTPPCRVRRTARLERGNSQVTAGQVRDWCQTAGSVVGEAGDRPGRPRPGRVRWCRTGTPRLVALRDKTCVFPWCSRPARRCDKDHSVPHSSGGPTCPCNLAPLCRRHHRIKTHGAWTYRRSSPAPTCGPRNTGTSTSATPPAPRRHRDRPRPPDWPPRPTPRPRAGPLGMPAPGLDTVAAHLLEQNEGLSGRAASGETWWAYRDLADVAGFSTRLLRNLLDQRGVSVVERRARREPRWAYRDLADVTGSRRGCCATCSTNEGFRWSSSQQRDPRWSSGERQRAYRDPETESTGSTDVGSPPCPTSPEFEAQALSAPSHLNHRCCATCSTADRSCRGGHNQGLVHRWFGEHSNGV